MVAKPALTQPRLLRTISPSNSTSLYAEAKQKKQRLDTEPIEQYKGNVRFVFVAFPVAAFCFCSNRLLSNRTRTEHLPF